MKEQFQNDWDKTEVNLSNVRLGELATASFYYKGELPKSSLTFSPTCNCTSFKFDSSTGQLLVDVKVDAAYKEVTVYVGAKTNNSLTQLGYLTVRTKTPSKNAV